MLELVRSAASVFTLPTASTDHGGLVVGLAQTSEELESIQRLRYDVFSAEFAAVLDGANDGLDRDAFDPWCDHLMVRESGSDRVIGTYRLLTPVQARRAGGYYSESEFDLAGLGSIRDGLVEFGRACIHEDHRQGGALMMLWSGPLPRCGGRCAVGWGATIRLAFGRCIATPSNNSIATCRHPFRRCSRDT